MASENNQEIPIEKLGELNLEGMYVFNKMKTLSMIVTYYLISSMLLNEFLCRC